MAQSVIAPDPRAEKRAGIIEALERANRHAKRQQYVVEPFAADRPTQWTKAHRYIDSLLDQLEAS